MIVNDSNLGAKTSQKEPEEYHCKKCDYTTCKLANWKRHLKTKKHNDSKDSNDSGNRQKGSVDLHVVNSINMIVGIIVIVRYALEAPEQDT